MAKLTLTDPSAGYNSTSVIAANNTLVEAAVENTLSRDGTAPNQMEANLDMNSYRVTNLPDAVGNQEPLTLSQASSLASISTAFTQENVGAVLYPETSAETSAGVTPTNYYYEPGDVRRYGAVGDAVTDDTTAIQSAFDLAKSAPGTAVYFPKGSYLVTTSLDATYDGVAGGLSSGYFGFKIYGDDKYNSYILGKTNGTPVIDFTGKPRMTIRDFSIVNLDDTLSPSCAMLFARNTTNGGAGGHHIDGLRVWGYFTDTLIQCASSEGNHWYDCVFEVKKAGCDDFHLTDQIQTTVNSEYIDLSTHTFSGGNTSTYFSACSFLNVPPSGTSGDGLVLAATDNVTFDACYTNADDGSAFVFNGTNTSVRMVNIRDESAGTYFINFESGSSTDFLSITGRASRQLYGADTSVLTDCHVDPQFMASGGTHSVDLYDCTDGYIGFTSGITRIRNNARGTTIDGYRTASNIDMPTGATTAPKVVTTSYTGGDADHKATFRNSTPEDREVQGRTNIESLSIPAVREEGVSGTKTPDFDVSSHYYYEVTGNTTIANPDNVQAAANDSGLGQVLIVTIEQDGVGGHTVSFGAKYNLNGASVSTTAGDVTSFMFTVFEPAAGGTNLIKIS